MKRSLKGKKPHWTQLPENRAKVRDNMRRASEAKNGGAQPASAYSADVLTALDDARTKALARIGAIDQLRQDLGQERDAICAALGRELDPVHEEDMPTVRPRGVSHGG